MNTIGQPERATPNRVILNRKEKFRRSRAGKMAGYGLVVLPT